MATRNIAQQYAIFFVLNSVTVPQQHMENFSRLLEMMHHQQHKPLAGTRCFLKAEPFLTMSSALYDHQQRAHVTTYHVVISCADPVRNVSWMLFPEGRSSELRIRWGVGQAAHTLNNPQVECTGVLLWVIME